MANYFSNRYPYTDFHELNLDWLIRKMRELEIDMDEFKVVNNITFSGQWDITKQYPAWTIVNDNNIGYVSIQPVPVGVVLTNTDYWVEVIDYSTQIAGLQNRVVALENTVGDNNSGLVKDVNDLNADVDDLNNKVNRHYLFLGDSYYLGSTDLSYSGIGWASQVVNFLGLNPSQYTLATSNDITNGYISTPGFHASAGTHRSFKTILETVAGHLTSEQIEKVTDIVVAGGYNDISQGNNIITGIEDYVSYAKSTFPNARLWCAHIGFSTNTDRRYDLIAVRHRYRSCIKYGMNYISAAEFVLSSDDLFLVDGIHPTEAGYKMIGASIANALVGGGCAYSVEPSFKKSTFLSPASQTYGDMACSSSEYGRKTIVITALSLVFSTHQSCSYTNPLKVYFTNPMVQPTGNNIFETYINLHEYNVGDHYEQCVVTIGQDATGKYLAIAPMKQTINLSNVDAVLLVGNQSNFYSETM